MNIRERADYRFKKFTRFLKEKKLYGKFKKKVISVCTRQNKLILFTPSYYYSDTNIIETNYMIYAYFHDNEEYRNFYEEYEFSMVNDNSRAYYENYKNAIKEWRRVVTSENL